MQSFRFDLVDVARCVIAANFSAVFGTYKDAFAEDNRDETKTLSETLLSIIDDYDSLLSSNEHFMVCLVEMLLPRHVSFCFNPVSPGLGWTVDIVCPQHRA